MVRPPGRATPPSPALGALARPAPDPGRSLPKPKRPTRMRRRAPSGAHSWVRTQPAAAPRLVAEGDRPPISIHPTSSPGPRLPALSFLSEQFLGTKVNTPEGQEISSTL